MDERNWDELKNLIYKWVLWYYYPISNVCVCDGYWLDGSLCQFLSDEWVKSVAWYQSLVINSCKQANNNDEEEEYVFASVEDTSKIVDANNNLKNASSDTSGVSTALNEWTVEDTRQWLQWAVSQDTKHLDPVLLALEKAVEGSGNENEDISKKRKRTAGQVVQVT